MALVEDTQGFQGRALIALAAAQITTRTQKIPAMR
jgi:hypothetical protein